MTEKEKARAYDEALERAKKLYEQGTITESLNYVFPELTESEDERISREITEFILTHRIDEPNDIEDTNSWLVWLEKQGEKPKKVSIWKHWKDGIAGGTDEQVFLIKTGNIYSISSCLGCECDYIELSELDKLMREEKQGWQKWNEEDIKFIDMLIKEKEDAIDLSCDVKESISLIYCCNALKLIKQRMKEQL